MKQTQPVKDNRPGYVRQQEEPVTIACECGAVVVEGLKGLVHLGPCGVAA